MEIIGWITIILLCALALTFIIVELGPMIHTEISSWKIRKQKVLEAREDKSRYKQEMKDLKRKVKKLKYMKKHGLDTTELELGLQSPQFEKEEEIEESSETEVKNQDTEIVDNIEENIDLKEVEIVEKPINIEEVVEISKDLKEEIFEDVQIEENQTVCEDEYLIEEKVNEVNKDTNEEFISTGKNKYKKAKRLK